MFAVPGWAVSATSLKIQTSHSSPSSHDHKKARDHKEDDKDDAVEKYIADAHKSRKRKRAHPAKGNAEVTEANLASLWSKYIEGGLTGGDGDENNAKRKRKRKEGKPERDGQKDGGRSKAKHVARPLVNEAQTTLVNTLQGDSLKSKSVKKGKNSKGKQHSLKSDVEPVNESTANNTHPPLLERSEREEYANKAPTKSKGGSVGAQRDSFLPQTSEYRKFKKGKHDLHEQPQDPKSKRLDSHSNPTRVTTLGQSPSDDTAKSSVKNKCPTENGRQNGNASKPKPASSATPHPLPAAPASKLTPLQQKMRAKLTSARFRHLNETLYTTPSSHAQEIFNQNPDLFSEYHLGFSQQVQDWPENPVDGYIAKVKAAVLPRPHGKHRPKARDLPSPTIPRTKGTCTIADLGCGDASLAMSLAASKKSHQLQVLSYDFRKSNDLVTVADITRLPIEDRSIDVTIFCLSLMGTNWIEYIEEAWRVLRFGGECWISEVKSRFGRGKKSTTQKIGTTKMNKAKKRRPSDDDGDDESGPENLIDEREQGVVDETDVSAFVDVFQRRGFTLKPDSIDKSNKMFVRMEFQKTGAPPSRGKWVGGDGVAVGQGRARGDETGATWKMKKPKMKFIEDGDVDVEEEAKVLKPCVYKTR